MAVSGHQEIYGGDEGLRHHLCLHHAEHREPGTSRQELEDLHEEEHGWNPAHRGEYSCPEWEHTEEDEPTELSDMHDRDAIGEIHRGIGVSLPDELHRFVHDPSRPAHERARALMEHVSDHPEGGGHLGTHWTTENNVAEGFAEENAGWKRDEDDRERPDDDFSFGHHDEEWEGETERTRLPKPGTAVVFHAHPPSAEAIDRNPHRPGNGDVYGYSEHGEREVPITSSHDLDLRGVSWAQVHSEDDPRSDLLPQYEHHDFAHGPRTAALHPGQDENGEWFYGEKPAHLTDDLPAEMHRGVGYRLPPEVHEVVHDASRPLHERAQALLGEMDRWSARGAKYGEGGIGIHWSTKPSTARGFATRYDTQNHGLMDFVRDPASTQVVFHAQTAAPNQMLRSKRKLDEHEIFGVNHGEGEIPLKKRSRVHLNGISWAPNGDESAELTRYDFPQPVRRTAGVHTAPDRAWEALRPVTAAAPEDSRRYYHASYEDFEPGDTVSGGHRLDDLYLADSIPGAHKYYPSGHVYEVEPHDEPQPSMEHEYTVPSGTVTRRVPEEEVSRAVRDAYNAPGEKAKRDQTNRRQREHTWRVKNDRWYHGYAGADKPEWEEYAAHWFPEGIENATPEQSEASRRGTPLPPDVHRWIHGTEAAAKVIDLYHHTTPGAAAAIVREKRMTTAGEPEVFFTTDPDPRTSQAAGRGGAVVHMRVPERLARLDDEFPSGEQHYAVDPGSLRPSHFVGVISQPDPTSASREASVQHHGASGGEEAPEGHQIWAVPAEGRSPVAAEVYRNMTSREPGDEHGSAWYQGISYHGPYHVIRHPQTRQVWLVDRHGRDASPTGGHYGNPERDGNWGEHQAWEQQFGLESAGPEAHRFGTPGDMRLNAMNERVPEFPHTRVDPEDVERVNRPPARVHAPEGYSPSDEYHGSYEVVQHPESGRFHVVDNAGRHATTGNWNGFGSKLQAERSRDYIEKRQRSKEIGRGLAEGIWERGHEALDPGGTAESRQSEENMATASDMMRRYDGGLGEIKFDSDEEGGAPYYEREHLLGSGRPSGWYVKHYGGAHTDVYHRATGDVSHQTIHLPQHPEDENVSMTPRLHPDFGDEHLAGALRNWHDDQEGGEREYIERNDPRISRWKKRHLAAAHPVVAHFEDPEPRPFPATTAREGGDEEYGPKPKFQRAPDDWPQEQRDAHHQRQWDAEKDWTSRIRRGLGTGALDHARARELGYYGQSHETPEELYDNEGNRVVHRGWQPLPGEMYHVTTNMPAVREHGLKSRAELGQHTTGGLGLGGGEDDTISVTSDYGVARGILRGMHEYHDVLNGRRTPQQMWDEARAGEGAREPFHRNLARYYKGDWEEGDPLPRGLDEALRGKKVNFTGGSTQQDIDRYSGPGWSPHPESGEETGEDGVKRHDLWERDATPDERMHQLSDFYKNFSYWRQWAGGHPDPLFVANDVKGFAAADPAHFGLVHVRPRPGGHGYPLSTMKEWRTTTGDALEVHRAERMEHGHLKEAAVSLASRFMPGLPNPHTRGEEWFHGTHSRPEDLQEGFHPSLPDDHESQEMRGHMSYWNTHLGSHWAAAHSMAEHFARAGASVDDPEDEDWHEPYSRYEERAPSIVVHAKLHLRNPKVYASEHDMDNEAYEHETRAGNWISNHFTDGYEHEDPSDPDYDPESPGDDEEWQNAAKFRHDSRQPLIGPDEHPIGYGGPFSNDHPGQRRRAQWLSSHPDKAGIVSRFRQRLIDQGHDGIVYGNELETEHAGGGEHGALSAIAFHPHQVEITQHHDVDRPCLAGGEAERQRSTMPQPGQEELPGVEEHADRFPNGFLRGHAVVAHFAEPAPEPARKTAAPMNMQLKLFHQQPDPNLNEPGSGRHNPSDPEAGYRYRREHDEDYRPDECPECGGDRHFREQHEDEHRAYLGDQDWYTDWEDMDMPSRIHRGMAVHLPQGLHDYVHDESHPVGDRATALARHLVGHPNSDSANGLGHYWSEDPDQSKGYAEGRPSWLRPEAGEARERTPVMVHAHFPGREHIETDPETLRHWKVLKYGYGRDNLEYPISEGAPIRLSGISWARPNHQHHDVDFPLARDDAWTHHEFGGEGMRASAALEVVAHFADPDDPASYRDPSVLTSADHARLNGVQDEAANALDPASDEHEYVWGFRQDRPHETMRQSQGFAERHRQHYHGEAARLGHDMAWEQGEGWGDPGYHQHFVGTCRNCGASMTVGAGSTTSHDLGRFAREEPCTGPGTAWQNDLIKERRAQQLGEAVQQFSREVKDIHDRQWLKDQGIEPTASRQPPVLYHGTDRQYEPGDEVSPEYAVGFRRGQGRVFATTDPAVALRYGNLKASDPVTGSGTGRAYEVTATGPVEPDDTIHENFRGWRSAHPFRVVREVTGVEPVPMTLPEGFLDQREGNWPVTAAVVAHFGEDDEEDYDEEPEEETYHRVAPEEDEHGFQWPMREGDWSGDRERVPDEPPRCTECARSAHSAYEYHWPEDGHHPDVQARMDRDREREERWDRGEYDKTRFCGVGCEQGHHEDMRHGVRGHHTFSVGEPEWADNPHPLDVDMWRRDPHSQNPHAEPTDRRDSRYEVRDPSAEHRCHYCRNILPQYRRQASLEVTAVSGDSYAEGVTEHDVFPRRPGIGRAQMDSYSLGHGNLTWQHGPSSSIGRCDDCGATAVVGGLTDEKLRGEEAHTPVNEDSLIYRTPGHVRPFGSDTHPMAANHMTDILKHLEHDHGEKNPAQELRSNLERNRREGYEMEQRNATEWNAAHPHAAERWEPDPPEPVTPEDMFYEAHGLHHDLHGIVMSPFHSVYHSHYEQSPGPTKPSAVRKELEGLGMGPESVMPHEAKKAEALIAHFEDKGRDVTLTDLADTAAIEAAPSLPCPEVDAVVEAVALLGAWEPQDAADAAQGVIALQAVFEALHGGLGRVSRVIEEMPVHPDVAEMLHQMAVTARTAAEDCVRTAPEASWEEPPAPPNR